MLFDQIDRSALKRISAEVKVDLKLASVTLREADNGTKSRTAKLQVVERFIDKYQHVGTVQEPGGEYFRGQMDMQWGFPTHRHAVASGDGVCFMGYDSERTHLTCLVGSRHHVLGENPPNVEQSRSSLPSIIDYFGGVDPGYSEGKRVPTGYDLSMFWEAFDAEDGIFSGLPKQHMEFLAVPLAEEKFLTHVVLGTPLYVALAQ